MKKYLFLPLLLLFAMFTSAQKVGYVDTDYILEKVPEYAEAQRKLDDIASEWQNQLEKKYSLIEKMNQDLKAEEILLTDEMKSKRRQEIRRKEKEALEYQRKKFGVDGELFKERQKIVKPIQDKVYKAMKEVARSSGYAILLDKAGSTTLIYTNPKYNKSDAVLKKLGYDTKDE